MTVRVGGDLQVLAAAGKCPASSFRTPCPWVNDNLPGGPTRRRDGHTGVTATWQLPPTLGNEPPPLPVLPPGTLIHDLEQLSRNLLAVATVLDRDYAGMSWAIDCVAAKRKPSSAKGPVKDCHILGHALCLSASLGAAYPNSLVLVSSNR